MLPARASAAACADDVDVDVFGPTSRTSQPLQDADAGESIGATGWLLGDARRESFALAWTELSATWHIDPHWAVSLEGERTWQTDSNTTYYLNDVHAARGLSAGLGVRWTF